MHKATSNVHTREMEGEYYKRAARASPVKLIRGSCLKYDVLDIHRPLMSAKELRVTRACAGCA
jgi:hypothetical protein